LKHLLSVWPEVEKQLKPARHILILTDYDGTLTPIVKKPELAVLSPDTKQLLQVLSREPRFTLGIISGRSLQDLKKMVDIKGILYAGNHGLEIEGHGINYTISLADQTKRLLKIIGSVLERSLSKYEGVFVENKGLSLSVHYRLAEEEKANEIERLVKLVVKEAEASRQVTITSGKKVFEVRPVVEWDKGKAIKYLLTNYSKNVPVNKVFTIYLGDDLTDEDGFQIINDYGAGLSVFIGECNTQSFAQYYLRSTAEVTMFFRSLLKSQGIFPKETKCKIK
jgi:trehalose 6-phosphate phosphatase